MTYSSLFSDYAASGLFSARPVAATLSATIPTGMAAYYYATDTTTMYMLPSGASVWVAVGAQLDTDTTMAANSDDRIPTQKAVKAAIAAGGGGGGGGGDLVKIATYTCIAGDTTHTFSSIPGTYEDLIISVNGQASGGLGADVLAQFNGDTGSNYDWYVTNASGSGHLENQTSGGLGRIATTSNGFTNTSSCFDAIVHDYANTVFDKTWSSEYHDWWGSGGSHSDGRNAGQWRPSTPAAITSVTIFPTGGKTFIAGTKLTIYGRG